MTSQPDFAPASVRNSMPIIGVLQDELSGCRTLLEIGSGTGHHGVTFAAAMPELVWQTSDLDENHALIEQAIEDARIDNVLRPLLLDVRDAVTVDGRYDAVYTCNTAHIMSFSAVEKMIALVGRLLAHGGLFICYGPFKRNGCFNTRSNAAFDESLRARDSEMGIRDLDVIDTLAKAQKLNRQRVYAMPTNNLLVVWRKIEGAAQ